MPLVLNPDNRNRVVDRTNTLIQIPNNVGITNALGLFTPEYSTQKTIEVTRTKRSSHLVVDRNWDERNSTIAGRDRDSLLLKIPHFPLDDAITPNDIDGVVQADSLTDAMELETVASVRADKMMDLRESHGITLEAARMQLITTGTVYAPTGTLRQGTSATTNFYTEFGVTQTVVPVDLSSAADPRGDFRDIKAAIRAGLTPYGQGAVSGFVALVGSDYFAALMQNAFVTDAVKYTQGPLNAPVLTGVPGSYAGLDARFETITMWGITFIDASAAGYEDASGTFVPFVADDEAYFLPLGVRDMFKTYYAPANRFGTINRRAQGSYWFEYANEKDDIIEIMTEQNFLNACLYPAAVVKSELSI